MTEVALDGARRVMRQMGMLHDGGDCAPRPARLVQVADPACSHFAPHGGLFDPLVEVGTDVAAGDLAGWLRDPFEMDRPPTELRFALSGHLAIRGTRGLVGSQDLLFGLVTEV
jgi:predicted deacylase